MSKTVFRNCFALSPLLCQVPKLQPGAVVAIHSRYTGRYMRMNGENLNNIFMDGSAEQAASELPSDWT